MDKAQFESQIRKAAEETGEQIKVSAMFLSLFTHAYREDPMACLQLGIAVSMDKPIFMMVPEGEKVPESIKLLAKGIEFYDPKVEDSMKAATGRLVDKWERYKIKTTGH